MTDEQSQIKKFRSPPYPAIGIDKSIDRAKQLYQKALHHGVGVPVLADAWAYGEKSSGLFATAAALIQFGLLSDDGTGAKRKFTLTDAAVRIIRDADPASVKRLEAIQAAALKPMIHRELWTRFGAANDVSPVVLKNYLTLDRGDDGRARYSDQGADEVIRVYLGAIKFSGLAAEDYVADVSAETNDDQPMQSQETRGEPSSTIVDPMKVAPLTLPGERELISGLLSRDAGFRVVVYGNVGPKEIDRLIAKLQLDREILADLDES